MAITGVLTLPLFQTVIRSSERILPGASRPGGHTEDLHHHPLWDVRVLGNAVWPTEHWEHISAFNGSDLRRPSLLFCVCR